jgi:biopolymer transport protein ExbD
MAGKSSSDGGFITGINVTPLVDVVLVLLIIFMATAPLLQKRALHVNVPQASHSERRATAAVEVQFTADRKVLVDGAELPRERLEGDMRSRLALDPGLAVAVSADEAVPYGEVIGLLDAVRGAGVKKVALDVRPGKR